jgi:hypothetical protein
MRLRGSPPTEGSAGDQRQDESNTPNRERFSCSCGRASHESLQLLRPASRARHGRHHPAHHRLDEPWTHFFWSLRSIFLSCLFCRRRKLRAANFSVFPAFFESCASRMCAGHTGSGPSASPPCFAVLRAQSGQADGLTVAVHFAIMQLVMWTVVFLSVRKQARGPSHPATSVDEMHGRPVSAMLPRQS